MGFLQKLFGGSSEPKDIKTLPWISLIETQQLDEILERSKTRPQLIFKYSTRCSISRMMMNSFVDTYELSENELDLYYLDIITYRAVSNAVAHKFNVVHESPQVLVIKHGAVVAQASHGAIAHLDLKAFV